MNDKEWQAHQRKWAQIMENDNDHYQMLLKQVNKSENIPNLFYALAEHIAPRLKKFKEITKSYPGEFSNFEEWHAVLNKMIDAFEFTATEEFPLDIKDESQFGIHQEGLNLFAKYYWHLWS